MVRKSRVALAAIAALSVGPAPADAQVLDLADASNWLVGYVVNAPEQLLGFGTIVTLQRLGGFGLYADAKFGIDSPARDRTFVPGRTPLEAAEEGDTWFRDDDAWTAINLALVKGIGEEFALYAGAGYSRRTVYENYLQAPAEAESYWIEDPARQEEGANFIGGGFFRMSNRILFQFGAETAPRGFTAGMHVRLR